ncbi:MAG: hypothetical protein KatS3mg057_3227 [Herpetosiphonaceae bacterium]|nr:MAG: hypothetical protein KatS3mg057_3227 [Herpetosiphonaceae bacterium]
MPGTRRYLLILLLGLLSLLLAACRLSGTPAIDQAPAATPASSPSPRPTRPPQAGTSRSNPVPRSQTVEVGDWEIRVLDVKRGAAALETAKTDHPFVDPPPQGMEYLRVKLWVKSAHTDQGEYSPGQLDVAVTGERFVEYRTVDLGQRFGLALWPHDLQFAPPLTSGQSTEGWATFLVPQEERKLILILGEFFGFDQEKRRFIALEEGAAVAVPPELRDRSPNALGKRHTEPAPFGEKVSTHNWELAVLDVLRGEEAWQMLQAEPFAEPPEPGREYLLVKLRMRYIKPVDESEMIFVNIFRTRGSAGQVYEQPSMAAPPPRLDCRLYPGGECEGWVVLQAGAGESGMMLIFDPPLESGGNRYLSLER